MEVVANERLSGAYSRLILKCNEAVEGFDFAEIEPGQFVQVRVDDSKNTFLRRPISVNFVVPEKRELHLLVRRAGEGTEALCQLAEGAVVNLVMSLGRGFSYAEGASARTLLVGGGVGVAPLLYLGKLLKDRGLSPTFLLAARSGNDLLLLDEFRKYGDVEMSTDDGSMGHPGLVVANPALEKEWDKIYCCGPMPMMKAIAKIAREKGVECEVSLENTMACGLGACLCCVEDTVNGNVCVCTEGPVFNIDTLKWFD